MFKNRIEVLYFIALAFFFLSETTSKVLENLSKHLNGEFFFEVEIRTCSQAKPLINR